MMRVRRTHRACVPQPDAIEQPGNVWHGHRQTENMPYESATSSSGGLTTLEAAESQMESATESWGSLDAIAEKLNTVAEEASNGGIIRSSRPVWVWKGSRPCGHSPHGCVAGALCASTVIDR